MRTSIRNTISQDYGVSKFLNVDNADEVWHKCSKSWVDEFGCNEWQSPTWHNAEDIVCKKEIMETGGQRQGILSPNMCKNKENQLMIIMNMKINKYNEHVSIKHEHDNGKVQK